MKGGAALAVGGAALQSFTQSKFNPSNDNRPDNSSVGKLLRTMGVEKTAVDNGVITPIPALDTPEHETIITKPSLTTLHKQMNELVAVAKKLGVISQKQQEAMIAQIKDANRVAKENQAESAFKDAENISKPAIDDLALTGALSSLINSLSGFSDKLGEVTEQTKKGGLLGWLFGGAAAVGAGGLLKRMFGFGTKSGGKMQPPKIKRGYGWDEKTGRYYKQGRGGRRAFVREEEALRNPNRAQLRTSAAEGRRLEKTSEAAAKGKYVVKGEQAVTGAKTSTSIAKKLKMTRRAGAKITSKTSPTVIKRAIMKAAGPIAKNALTKTAIKSIPIIGAAAGIGMAASRLLEGDYVGAGLDAASGLGGPITAIPALTASIARDVYSETFQKRPEDDPLFASRMALVMSTVKDIVEKWLTEQISTTNPTNKPTGNFRPARGESPALRASRMSAATPSTSPVSRTSSSPVLTGAASAPAFAASAMSTAMDTVKEFASNKPTASTPPPSPATPVESVARSGAELLNASTETEQMPSAAPDPFVRPVRPSNTPTTRANSSGMGNVPDPTYYDATDAMLKQIYFGASV